MASVPLPVRSGRIRLGLRLRPDADGVLAWLVTVALFVLIAAPLGAVVVQAFVPGLFYGDRTFQGFGYLLELFERRLWRVSLYNSLTLAGGTAIFGTALGCALALLRHGYRFPLARTLDTAAWALLIMPSFIVAQGWVLFAARGGIAPELLGAAWVSDLVFSPTGLILVMSLKTYPFAYLTMSAALRWNVADLGHAARLCGAGAVRVFFTVRLPLLVPAILAGMVLVFVDTIGDFGLPAALATTYRFPTLPYTIYTAINQAPIRFDLAGVLSFYLISILAVAVALHVWIVRTGFYEFLTARARPSEPAVPRHAWLCTAVTVVFLLIAIGLPLGTSVAVSFMDRIGAGFVWDNLTLAHYAATLSPGSRLRESLANSFTIAALAGLASIVLGLAAAYLLTLGQTRLRTLIDVTCTTTLAVPGVILGVGTIFVWNQRWLDDLGLSLYGHPAILVLAAIAGAVPIAVRVLLGALAQVPPSFLAAAALQGAGLPRRLLTILLPLLATAILSATLAAFGTSVFDLAISSLLRPPGFEVIPVTINRQFQQGEFGLSTASTVIAAGLTIAAIVTVQVLFDRFVRIGAGRPA
ncbi:MAG: iron ABC transporter permease [Geminicoccaceae bacterium]|nr:MAG: iron ABC transporter permease [Geminicoccaceae bacterium]